MKVRMKRGLSLDEHLALGRELKTMRERLVSLAVELGNKYSLSTNVLRKADKTYRAIDELRWKLEDIVFGEHPEREGANFRIYHPHDGGEHEV